MEGMTCPNSETSSFQHQFSYCKGLLLLLSIVNIRIARYVKVPFLLQPGGCGVLMSPFRAHLNGLQNLTFLLELRKLARSHLVSGRREKGQLDPWLLKDTPSSPYSEDRCISELFTWARSKDSPSELQDLKVRGTFIGRTTALKCGFFNENTCQALGLSQDRGRFNTALGAERT